MNFNEIGGIKFRKAKNSIFQVILFLIAVIITIPLALIIFYIIVNGISVINWKFLTTLTAGVGEEGGIANSLIGTVILALIATILSVPISIAAGIYLGEHKESKLANYIRLSIQLLQGIPSIVIGLIGYLWIVRTLGGYSALAGGIALALMMFPMIITSTEETIKLIPHTLKEASIALGVPYYKTMLKVILPASMSGIVTGVLIAVARIMGETAPILFTAFGNRYFNVNILKPIDALPILIYTYAGSPYEEWHKIAWGASFVLVMFVLILNLVTRLVVRRWKIEF